MTFLLWGTVGASLAEVATPLRIEWPENALSFVGDDTRALVLPFAVLVLGLAIQGWKMRRMAEVGRARLETSTCSVFAGYIV